MSYILDALNKADQTRKQGQDVTQPVAEPSIAPPQKNKHVSSLSVVLILSFGFAFLWFAPWQHVSEKKAPPAPIKTNKIERVDQLQASKEVIITDTLAAQTQPDIMKTEQNVQPNENLTLAELPQTMLDQLPAITISAHNHHSVPSKSMAIINNKALHEGGRIAGNLVLKSITAQGVILEFDGVLFSMNTFETWPY